MNPRILISLSVIGAVAAIAIGGTVAYFSDTAVSTGNTITAGTLDLKINGKDNPTGIIKVGPMAPGVESVEKVINFRNVGTLNGKASFTMAITGDADKNTLAPGGTGVDVSGTEFATKVYVISAKYTPAGGSERDVLSVWKEYADGVDGSPKDGNLSLWEITRKEWEMTEPLLAGRTAFIKLKFMLDKDVDNRFQGDGVEMSVTATLKQVNQP